MMTVPSLVTEDLTDEGQVQAFALALSGRLLTPQDKSVEYEVFVRQDPERGFYYPVVRRTAHSVATDTVLSRGFFASPEYLALRAVGEGLDCLIVAVGFF